MTWPHIHVLEGRAGIPAGMPGAFESVSGGVAALDHRLHAGMPSTFP
jgi:hypothetical protein